MGTASDMIDPVAGICNCTSENSYKFFFFLEYAGELRIIVLIEEKGVIQRPKHTHTHTNTTPTHLARKRCVYIRLFFISTSSWGLSSAKQGGREVC
jgi:hypothetical protein